MRAIDADELIEHVYREAILSRKQIADMINNAPTIEAVNGDKYLIETKHGRFYIVAAELETKYDAKGQFDYVVAFDENGQSIAYFNDVVFWLQMNGLNRMVLNADKMVFRDIEGEEHG